MLVAPHRCQRSTTCQNRTRPARQGVSLVIECYPFPQRKKEPMPMKKGFPPGANVKGGQNAAPRLAELADEFYAPILPIIKELYRQKLSLRAIARELQQRGIA